MHRRRASGPLLRHFDEASRPAARGAHVRAQCRRRDLWLGRRLFRPDGRKPDGQRPRLRPHHRRRIRPLGRHRRPYPRSLHPLVGPRLHRHRPQAAARNPGRPRPRAWRRDPLRNANAIPTSMRGSDWDLVIAADGINSRFREAHAEPFRRRHPGARQPLRLARHAQDLRRLHLRLRENRGGLDLGPCLSLRRRLLDLHRRMLGRDLARPRLRPDGPGRGDRAVRAHLRQISRRPAAAQQCRAPARLRRSG